MVTVAVCVWAGIGWIQVARGPDGPGDDSESSASANSGTREVQTLPNGTVVYQRPAPQETKTHASSECVGLPVTSGGEITVLKAPAPPGLEAELEGTKARVTYDVGDPPDTCRPDSISITVHDRRKPTSLS